MSTNGFKIDRLKVGGLLTTREALFVKAQGEGQMILQAAKLDRANVVCLCNGESQPVYMTMVTVDKRIHLRRLPRQGGRHNHRCVSYGGISDRASDLYTEGAICEKGDFVHINLDGPLSEVTGEPVDYTPTGRDIKATKHIRRSSMSMLGLLNYMWEEASLNIWWPKMEGKRGSWTVRPSLMEVCEGRTFKNGRRLRDFLFVPEPPRGRDIGNNGYVQASEDLLEHLLRVEGAGSPNEACYAIVVGEIRRIIDPRPGQRSAGLVMKFLDQPFWDNHGVIRRLDQSFPNSMARARARSAAPKGMHAEAAEQVNSLASTYRLIGIFAVGLSKNKDSVVLKQGAVMETSERLIPIASDYEGRVEFKLFSEGRAFQKPLVYDGERYTFPDFELLDTDSATRPVLEVYGYSGDEYEARKREKHVEYVRTRTPYWYWDLKATRDIPSLAAFPPAERYKQK